MRERAGGYLWDITRFGNKVFFGEVNNVLCKLLSSVFGGGQSAASSVGGATTAPLSPMTPAPASSDSMLPIIIGAAVGGVCLLCLLLLVGVLCARVAVTGSV